MQFLNIPQNIPGTVLTLILFNEANVTYFIINNFFKLKHRHEKCSWLWHKFRRPKKTKSHFLKLFLKHPVLILTWILYMAGSSKTEFFIMWFTLSNALRTTPWIWMPTDSVNYINLYGKMTRINQMWFLSYSNTHNTRTTHTRTRSLG